MERIRVGVIGAGAWSSVAHLPVLASDARVDLVVITSPDRETLRTLAGEFDVPFTEEDWRRAFAYDLDLIVVSSPVQFHREQVCESLASGAHVLCEKPFALTHPDALAMVAAANRSGKHLCVAYGWNTHPELRSLREKLHTASDLEIAIGTLTVPTRELLSGELPSFMSTRLVKPKASTYSSSMAMGGGALYANTSHMLAYALWATESTVADAKAETVVPSPSGADIHNALILRMANGEVWSLSSVSVTGEQRRLDWGWRVYGRDWSIEMPGIGSGLIQRTATGPPVVLHPEFDAGCETSGPTEKMIDGILEASVPAGLDAALAVEVARCTDLIRAGIQ